jgi:hypothetical protein
MHPLLRLAAFVCLLVLPAHEASAQMFVTTGRDTLRGLPGVEVLLEETPPELPHKELAREELWRAVAQRLRDGGVTLYESQGANPSSAKPYVYVQLTALPLTGSVQAVSIQVHLRQTVRSSVTESNIVNAMTWDAHTVAAVGPKDGAELRDLVLEMVGRFVEDWRAVNGGQTPQKAGVRP